MVDMLRLEVTPRVVRFLANERLRQNRVLVTKPHNKTHYELLHGRTPSIGFMRPFGYLVTIFNTLDPLGKFEGNVDEGFLVGYSNYDGDVAFDGKKLDFDAKKPESEVNVSSSSSAQSRKQDDKTKKEAKGKSHVESFTGYRDLSGEFEDCFDNSSNEVNAVDMPDLEDITYFNDKDVVGAEADFNNLETSITEEGFMVYQMDVKSAFLYGTIEEEVYVCQPPGFKDPDHPDKVYKVVKELYGLHQAPRAWYETLANYLLENGFQKGKIDQTLFIKKQKGDILLVQIYVDDIIFGATNKDLCKSFEKLMKDKF
nr:putative ribonuclease H-like domain-containing protein [Tanacetum cinerariifolium]